MLGVDDGIWQGNLDFADVLFIAATILFLIAAGLSFPRTVRHDGTAADAHLHPAAASHAYTWVVAFVALAALSLGFAVL